MSLGVNYFEFDDFLLDEREKVLLRNGKPVSITPKAFKLLLTLVKNHGHLLSKDDLMKTVWADSFVEEGNLTFTIRQLRKILEDDARQPAYIETIPRRGYRFIAEVEEIEKDIRKVKIPDEVHTTDKIQIDTTKSKFFSAQVITAVILFTAITSAFLYLQRSKFKAGIPILSAQFASEKLSTNGKVGLAAISPDGMMIVYISGNGGKKQSVWLRQPASGNNVEIIPPTDDVYGGLAFSPDGNFIYFARHPAKSDGQLDIYRVSIFGGIPTKIISDTQGWMSISPDGTKISYVRCFNRDDEFCTLWIADSADGTNERKLASRPRPYRIGDNEISPDGKTIAFAAGQSENSANDFSLMEVDLESGAERQLTDEKFFNIKSLVWLPDRSGLLITARKIPDKNFLIRYVALDTGKTEPLTNDSETYSALSLDKAGDLLVSTQVKPDFKLQMYSFENPSDGHLLADATTANFAPDGKILFSSMMSGSYEIWTINADASGLKQLTNNQADDSKPIASHDNNFIYFASNRTGEIQIWKMNADGSNQVQVTQKEGGFPLFASPDGKWIYYIHGRDRTLRRVSVEDRDEQTVYDKPKYRFAISPDGSRFAFPQKQAEEQSLVIVSIADGQIIKQIKLDTPKHKIIDLAWMPDGKSLAYILADGEFKNNTLRLRPLDDSKPRKITALGDEEISETSAFAISPDGKGFITAQGEWKHDAVLIKGLK